MLRAQTRHPLDPLTAAEISVAVATVRAAGATLEVNDIHQADACKATPAKFCGSKEVVPLHFRKENRRQGEMAQQRQRATTKGKENEQPSGSNGKEKNKVFMRPPPCLHRNDHLDILNAVYDFESKRQREGLPVENFVRQKIEACRALQNVGENIGEQYLIGKIVDLLSPSWMHVKRTIFQRYVIENATHLMNALMEDEHNVHYLWMEFEQGPMMPNSTVSAHILNKENQFHSLRKKGCKANIDNLVQAIVNNLPPTWPKATIFKNLKLNFMDMRALGAMLEEIETDIICLEALDKVEQQFIEQEEKQGKKPRRKVAKRRLEFDEL